jgi:hypothetical protein
VLVDEFQDTSPPQYMLARLMALRSRRITVVGAHPDPSRAVPAHATDAGGRR